MKKTPPFAKSVEEDFMCLSKVTRKYHPPLKEEVLAFKVVRKGRGVLYPPCSHHTPELVYDAWIKDTQNGQIRPPDKGTYATGFHAFHTRRGANALLKELNKSKFYKMFRLLVIPVILRCIVARGYQRVHPNKTRTYRAIVAREINCQPVTTLPKLRPVKHLVKK